MEQPMHFQTLESSDCDILVRTHNLQKRFGSKIVLDIDHNRILRGSVYGLVGPNGAGKTTFLRILAGIYQPDAGICQLDNQPIWEHPASKARILFLPDQPAFLTHSALNEMADLYRQMYPAFNIALFDELTAVFKLDRKARLKTFSKGMKRQAALCLVIAAQPDLLLLDEAFDGLDPVMRQVLKRVLAGLVADRGMSVVISSHNLRELEDFCDHLGLLHNGRILIEQELDDLKQGLCRIQVAWTEPPDEAQLRGMGLNLLEYKRHGSVIQLVASGLREDLIQTLQVTSPLLLEALPLTLEEIFIQTMEVNGYDIANIIE